MKYSPRKKGRMKPCKQCGVEFYCQACRDVGSTLDEKLFCGKACAVAWRRSQAPNRFWAKVDKTWPKGCWPWTGYRTWDKYGEVYINGKHFQSHRAAWTLTHGPIPKGMHVLHRCDNPPCCNPDHLWLGTNMDNMQDKKAKGRHKGVVRPFSPVKATAK